MEAGTTMNKVSYEIKSEYPEHAGTTTLDYATHLSEAYEELHSLLRLGATKVTIYRVTREFVDEGR
jgi:hypothetical protein